MTRETIYAALFALISGKAPFITTSRVLKHWNDVGPEEMPALFQVQKTEEKKQQRGTPAIWTLRTDLYLYVHTNAQQLGGSITASQLLNPLLDAVTGAFAIDDLSNNVCTLGGMVSHAWIDGAIETSEGQLGDHEIAIVPVAVLVPD